MSPEHKKQQEADEAIAKMLTAGISPDDIKSLLG